MVKKSLSPRIALIFLKQSRRIAQVATKFYPNIEIKISKGLRATRRRATVGAFIADTATNGHGSAFWAGRRILLHLNGPISTFEHLFV